MTRFLCILAVFLVAASCSSKSAAPASATPAPQKKVSRRIKPPPSPEERPETAAAFTGIHLRDLPGDNDAVVVFSDGEMVATCGNDGKVQLYQLPNRPIASLDGLPGDPRLAVSADGKLIAQGSNQSNQVRIWKSGEKEFNTLESGPGSISQMVFDDQGTSFAVCCTTHAPQLKGEIAVWNLDGKAEPVRWETGGAVLGLAFSPDGKRLASAGNTAVNGPQPPVGEAVIWDVSNGQSITKITNDRGGMYAVAFSHQGDLLAVSEYSGPHSLRMAHQIRLVDPQSGATKGTLMGHAGEIRTLAFSPDDQFALSAGQDHVLRVWQIPTHSLRSMFDLNSYKDGQLTMSRDGSRLAIALGRSPGDTAVIPAVLAFDFVLRGAPSEIPGESSTSLILQSYTRATVSDLKYSNDGKSLAFSTNTRSTWLYDTSRWKGRQLAIESNLMSPRFFPDLKTAATFGETTKLFDTETLSELHDFHNPLMKLFEFYATGERRKVGLLWAADISPDGKILATTEVSSPNQELRFLKLWDLPARKFLAISRILGSTPKIITFSRDSSRMATLSYSNFSHGTATCIGEVAVWDTKELADPVAWKRNSRVTSIERKVLSEEENTALASLSNARTNLRTTEEQKKNIAGYMMGSLMLTLSDEQKDGIAKVLRPLVREFDELEVATDLHDLNRQQLTLRPTHKGVNAFRFKIPGDQPVDLLWSVLISDGLINCGIVPAEGPLTHRPDLFAWCHSEAWDDPRADVGRVIESPDIVPGHEYILWFFSDTKESVETLVSLNVLPKGAFRQQGWGFPFDGEQFEKVPVPRRYRLFYHGQEVNSLAMSPDGTLVAAGSSEGLIKIWKVDSGEVVRSMTGSDMAFSPDSSLLAVTGKGEASPTIELWDLKKGEKLRVFDKGHFLGVSSIVFSPDGKHLASGGRDGLVTLWNVETGVAEPFPSFQ